MPTLFILNQSPFSIEVDTFIKAIQKDDSVLLIGDGCYGIQHRQIQDLSQNNAITLLNEDLKARGLTAPDNWKLINYDDFVAMTVSHQPVVTW